MKLLVKVVRFFSGTSHPLYRALKRDGYVALGFWVECSGGRYWVDA